jgi:dihydroneopterin aldolase
MDTISINNIECWTHIGVPTEEREREQQLLVSLELSLSTKQAGAKDDVSKTIDYEEVVHSIHKLAKKERKTIECFAEDIAAMVLMDYKPKGGVKVTVSKHIIPGTESAEVSIERTGT